MPVSLNGNDRQVGEKMRMVMLGPPGAGKGTQAQVLAHELSIIHISTGDIFRSAIKNKTDMGLKAQAYIDEGNLVPDKVTNAIVRERLEQEDCKIGFILDGFPRTLPQARNLDRMLAEMKMPLELVIEIQISDEEIIRRLENRRSCPKCGHVYHLIFNPPGEENLCDECHVELYQRHDDTRKVIKHRIEVYHNKTDKLEDYYRSNGILKEFNGEQKIEKVLEDILKMVKEESNAK